MSGYRGRTGPNFSEYLSNLNSLSPYDEENFNGESLEIDSDLAMFTNTDFTTSFDVPALPEETGFNYPQMNSEKSGERSYQDLLASQDGQPFNAAPINTSPADTPFNYNYNTPILPANATAFPIDPQAEGASHPTQAASTRRKADSETRPANPEEASRFAAEEDKRRRNTAASARFRVKKKQREQALERSVKEVNDHNSKLQAKVEQLEMENKWLKDLITEKNTIQSKEEIDAAFQKFKRESEERGDLRSESPRVKGVGTDA
jgi:hypothetical protein